MVMINDLWENELVVPRCSKYFSDFHCAQNGMMFGSSTEQFFGVPWSSLWQPSGKKNGIAHSKWPKLRGNPSQWKVNKGDRHLIDISLSSVSYFYAQVGLASLVNLKSIENCLNVFFNVSRFSMWCIIKYHQIASNIIIMSWNIQFQPFFSETRAKAGALQRTSIGKPRLLWWQPGNQGRQNDATQCFSGRLKSVQSYINLLAEFITWYNYLQLYDLK